MGGVLLALRGLFGGFVTKVLGDWRLLLAVVFIVVGGLIAFKIHRLESKLTDSQNQVKVEQQNNATLRTNNATLQEANGQNQVIITQLTADKQAAVASVSKLSSEIGKTNKSLADVQQKLDSIKDAPTKLTPYISQAIDGIQRQRDEVTK